MEFRANYGLKKKSLFCCFEKSKCATEIKIISFPDTNLISNSKIAIANVKLYFGGFYSAQTIVYYAILALQQR